MDHQLSSAGDSAALAERLDCFTEEQLVLLSNTKASTLEAWRKRGLGPSYIRFGRTYLYPRAAVGEFLQGRIRNRSSAIEGVL